MTANTNGEHQQANTNGSAATALARCAAGLGAMQRLEPLDHRRQPRLGGAAQIRHTPGMGLRQVLRFTRVRSQVG